MMVVAVLAVAVAVATTTKIATTRLHRVRNRGEGGVDATGGGTNANSYPPSWN
jgi:hypothetical protein